MKKRLLASLAVALTGSLMLAGGALALPTTPAGYSWNTADFWQPTDFTTAVEGTAMFTLMVENAGYESSFGLYLVDDITNPTSVTNTFEVFGAAAEPVSFQTLIFDYNGGVNVSKDGGENWTAFDDQFGFYFNVTNTGQTYYTAANLNSDSIEHVLTAYDSANKNVFIYLEDIYGGGDWDYNDMIVHGNDVAPVPEPATMLLLGSGLAGLAGAARRRRNKK